jgi:anti-sigma regulatory factor (Ser/Thr protein kinase)
MDATAAHSARTAVRYALGRWGVPHSVVDDAVLAASELVANVVLHARTAGQLEIELGETGNRLRLAVTDGSSAPPLARLVDGTAESGRGLAILAALSDRWGIDPEPQGKRVWIEMDLERLGVSPGVYAGATS